MREQFDSCSYDELTRCVHARVRWIREYTRFLADPLTAEYTTVRVNTAIRILSTKHEIGRLLKMRRTLKRSGRRNWDSSVLDENEVPNHEPQTEGTAAARH